MMSPAQHDAAVARTSSTVRIVGTGLLGTSVGLALRERGVDVSLHDASPAALALAVDYGAGRPATDADAPALVVVAVPPDVAADVVAAELRAHPLAFVTDVASVKRGVLDSLTQAGVNLSHYLGSHPMAGRERGGAIMARADLFVGRPWVLCVDDVSSQRDRAAALEALALDVGAIPVVMTTDEHDDCVALVSHLPQVVSTLLASRLAEGDTAQALQLAGQGLRDTTRIASSDPELWVQILAANHEPVRELLSALRTDLDDMIRALDDPNAPGAKRAIAGLLASGNAGVSRIPGKHGGSDRFATITVSIDDKPGELARLLTEIGGLGINVEDMRLEHSPRAAVGFVELAVLPSVVERATRDLTERGWRMLS